MRIAEVDQSGYLRARRVGEMAYKNNVKLEYKNITVTSEPKNIPSDTGATFDITYQTPEGYSFNGIYQVNSAHGYMCHIGGFLRNGTTGLCRVYLTNRSNVAAEDTTVNMGLSFVKITTE